MMNPIKQKYLEMSIPARRAFWTGIIYALLLLASNIALLPDLAHLESPLQIVTIAVPPLIGILTLVGSGLMFNRRVKAGGLLVAYATFAGMLIIPMATQGYGFIAAAVVMLLTAVIATQTQPDKSGQSLIWTSIVVTALILVIDIAWPFYRLGVVSSDATLASIMAAVLVLIFVGLLTIQFPSLPLTTKLIIVVLALSIVPMTIVGYASAVSSQRALVADANDSLASEAAQVAARLDAFVEYNLDSLRTEAQIGDIIELLELPTDQRSGSEVLESTNDILSAFKQRNPTYITSYAVFDRDGIAIADTSVDEIGLEKKDREYFVQPRDTGLPYVSDVRSSPVTGETSLYIAAPVRNKVGEFLGILRVRYDAKILQQLVSSQEKLGITAFTMLISNENVLLVHTEDPQLIFRSVVPLSESEVTALQDQLVLPAGSDQPHFIDLPGLAESNTKGKLGAGFTGEFHEAAFHEDEGFGSATGEQANAARMSTRPWTVVVAQPQAELLAPVVQQQRGNLIVGIVAAIIAVVVGGLIARYLANPIVKLTDVARQLASGNLEARAPVTTRDEIGALANTFNQMASQLSSLVTGLEQRVSDRTKALVTSSEVSRRLSTILEQDQLVTEVVNQLQRAFDYYHVHIYLFDPDQASLVMAGGTGEAGQVMLSRGHKLPRGRGLVGRAFDTGIPVLVPDVTRAEGWLPNPLLPDTQSELAVPIILGEQVLGVLDVQQNRVEGLKQDDVDLLQTIANQVAIGLQNARAYAETRRRADREAVISAISARIQHTTSAEDALKVAVRELGHVLGTRSTVQLGVKPAPQAEPGNGALGGQKTGQDN
jgi:putative methionine-R-sulfoxide reductase with GAF domain